MRVLLLCATAAAATALAAPPAPHYDYTLDCDAFSPHVKGDTCNQYGDPDAWARIVHRPLPDFYQDQKFGVFIHWGVYSVPSYGSEWFWHNYQCSGDGAGSVKQFADKNFPGIGSDYPEYAKLFRAELYDATAWVAAIKGAGAQYVLPVAKHHDGFCMWDARETSPQWNAVEVGPQRDVLTELYNASVKAGLDFGIYYSQGEWFDSNFVADAKSGFRNKTFIEAKVKPQRLDLVHRFPKAMIWHTDGGWMAPDAYWDNLDWLTYLVNDSPLAARVVSCNSMGVGCCSSDANAKSGVSPAQQDKCWEIGDAPSGGDRTTAGSVTGHFYTNQMTIQRGSWSWDRKEDKMQDFFSASELIWTLVSTTAWNGTLIMNIGPEADGRIPPIFLDRFQRIGEWLAVNGEAIYGSRVWESALPDGSEGATGPGFQNASHATYYTRGTANSGCQFRDVPMGCGDDSNKEGAVYAIFLEYPTNAADAGGKVVLHLDIPVGVAGQTTVALLGHDGAVSWRAGPGGNGVDVLLPAAPPPGSGHAWTLRFVGLGN